MALNFPDSPTLNQVYTDTTSGFSYQWDGVVWQSYSAAASKNISIIDDISGSFNSSTQTFALAVSGTSLTPANAQQLRVVLGGIVQEPGVDYTVSGSDITFTTPPSALLDCSIVSLGTAVPVSVPGDGSVTPAKLSTGGPSWNTAGDLTVSGNVSIGGTLTYEDVTNIDSVGLITARSGIVLGPTANTIQLGTGTTISSPSSDTFTVSTNGNERVRVDSSGRFGLGTSSPLGIFQARATTNGNFHIRTLPDVGGSGEGFAIDSLNDAQNSVRPIGFRASTYTFYGSGTTYATIDSSGRLGVGTTPSQALHVVGTADRTPVAFKGSGTGTGYLYADNTSFGVSTNSGNLGGTSAFVGVDSANHVLFITSGSERARIDSSGRLLVGTYSTSAPCSALIQGTSGSGNVGRLYLARLDSTPPDGSDLGRIDFADSGHVTAGQILAERDGGTWTSGSSQPTRLVFSTTADGASSPTERMRITQAGNINIATAGSEINVSTGSTDGATFYGATGTVNGVIQASNNAAPVALFRRRANDGGVIVFYRDTTGVGSISVTTTATAYNTSSDYRLKENVTSVTDGITRLQQLKPSRFNFIADPDKTVDGFLAHEVQTVVPEAITGEKDAVDADGNPEYQGIDQSKLVPLLTAALQEAIGRIEALEAEVAALKAQ